MLKENNIYEFEIIDTGMNLEGIAKSSDGKTVFIPHTLKGEKVKAKVLKVNKSYALANIHEFISKNMLREDIDCEYFNKCGGCQARYTTYENTLDMKKNNVINTLKKQDVDMSKINFIHGMGNPYYYRNKLQYPVRIVNKKSVMGMFKEGTHTIVENDYCLIQDETINNVAKDLFKLVNENNLKGYDEKTLKGDIRNIMVRIGKHTNEIMCILVINNRKVIKDKRIKKVVEGITKKYSNITSFMLNINDKNTNVILTDENVCIYGNEYITDYIGDYIFKISADSFFQVNTIQAEVLYNLLKEDMKLEKDKTLLELYSGVGSIGIFLAASVKNIYSVEIVASSVEAAKENAKLNNITNIINILGDATCETLKLLNNGKYFNYLVIDPPRKGLDFNEIELILKLKPEKIGYVSCNPATLARDLKLLSRKYEVEKIELVDLFPWTSHIESIAILKLK